MDNLLTESFNEFIMDVLEDVSKKEIEEIAENVMQRQKAGCGYFAFDRMDDIANAIAEGEQSAKEPVELSDLRHCQACPQCKIDMAALVFCAVAVPIDYLVEAVQSAYTGTHLECIMAELAFCATIVPMDYFAGAIRDAYIGMHLECINRREHCYVN